MGSRSPTRDGRARALIALGVLVFALGIAGPADGAMRTVKQGPRLCETTGGGGKFVKAPGFPGEKIDRRLRRDVRFLKRRFKIFVTDGYSLDPVHSKNGEHPIGLALDIVPDFAAGGSWRQITRLARWAEPRQNRPRAPFRWVGYNGDAGHGRGHHLHLSYAHSPTRFNKPARKIQSIKCPGKRGQPDEPDDGGKPDGGDEPESGGVQPDRGGGGGATTGGIGLRRSDLDRVHRETGGVSLRDIR